MTELTGRIAVVSGASRGVGLTIAKKLVEQGVKVAAVSRSHEPLVRVQKSLLGQPGAFHPFIADIGQPDDVKSVARMIREDLGAADILINAAGKFGPIQWIAESNPQVWVDTIMVDAVSAYLTTREFLPDMLMGGWGRIINVSSAGALHTPGPLNSAYGTAKVALNQFTRHLASEIAGTGVTANVIHPGDLKTDMWADIRDQAELLGPSAADYSQWARWVEETGGDPIEKSAELMLELLTEVPARNGEFCWIRDPIQAPIDSWGSPNDAQPWLK